MMTTGKAKVNVGRVGVAMRGTSNTGVVCWPHKKALSGQPGVAFFPIKVAAKPCVICTAINN